MAAATPRPVRIVRSPAPARSPLGETLPRPPSIGNRAGYRRARRLLALYLGTVVAAYLAMLALIASSPYAAIRQDAPIYAILSAIGAGSVMAGYLITIGRAPFAYYLRDGELVIRERFGSVRRYPVDAGLEVRVVGRHPPSLLSPEPTETIRLRSPGRREREYVLPAGSGETLLSPGPEAALDVGSER